MIVPCDFSLNQVSERDGWHVERAGYLKVSSVEVASVLFEWWKNGCNAEMDTWQQISMALMEHSDIRYMDAITSAFPILYTCSVMDNDDVIGMMDYFMPLSEEEEDENVREDEPEEVP